MVDAIALRYQKMFTDLGISSGRVAIYGNNEIAAMYSVFTRCKQRMPGSAIPVFIQDEILLTAMMTKDADEIEHIRQMGKSPYRWWRALPEYLTGFKGREGDVGAPGWLPADDRRGQEQDQSVAGRSRVEKPGRHHFCLGMMPGVPHSTGTASDPMRLGKTIVYDIFPASPRAAILRFYPAPGAWLRTGC